MRLDTRGSRPTITLEDEAHDVTPSQARALVLDRDLVVSAGAGAGKTWVLSYRYVSLLLEHAVDAARSGARPDPEHVLVLTFTEEAAEEMAERCEGRLVALIGAVRAQRADLDRYGPHFGVRLATALEVLLDGFDHARITTFHGFCARVLREFPAETGAPPGFAVLEPVEAEALRDDRIESALGRCDPERLRSLLGSFGGRRRLLEALRTAVDERWRTEAILSQHAAGEVAIDFGEVEPSPEAVGAWLIGVARPLLADVAALLRDAPDDSHREVVRGALARLAEIPDDPLLRNALYRRTLAALLTRDESRSRALAHHAFLGKKEGWEKRSYELAKLAFPGIADWSDRFEAARLLPTPVDAAMLAALQGFASVALDAIAALRAGLDARGSLDFAEMQHRAVRAVTSDEGLRDALRARHRRVMVDEFQDTDSAQWELVSALGRVKDAAADRIFLVGDVKQAIYGFRGGDVTVFSTAARELGVTPVSLPDNFRTRPDLIGWFNTLFSGVLGPPGPHRPPWEAPYEPLAPGRVAEGGSVTILRQASTRAAEDALGEAEAVARYVALEILGDRGPYAGDGPVEGIRVAILLRSRTRLGLFEHALRRARVPYVVAKGVGFWERPEIVDLVNALHALASGDPVSTVGWLRSPLLGVPDPEIFALTRGTWTREGAEPLRSLGRHALAEAAPPALIEASARIRKLYAVRDRVPPSALLRRILDVCAAGHAMALSDPHGQAEANAMRLVGMVARLDGRSSLAEVARWLLAQVESGARESQASIDVGSARVALLTVHASKGLEFPVVVLPELGARPDASPPPLALRRHRGAWAVACTVPDPEAEVAMRGRPALYEALESVRRQEEDAESKRLLYVAVTRARDHVVLVASIPDKPASAPRPGVWIDALLAQEPLRKALVGGRGEPPVRVLEITDVVAEPLPPAEPVPEPPPPPPEAVARIAPVPAVPEVEVSPSTLDLFEACPARWYRRHRLHIPEGPAGGGPIEPALPALRGVVLHGLLEDDLADDEGTALARFTAAVVGDGGTVEQAHDGFPELLDHLRRAAADPALRAVLDAPGHAELSFRQVRGHLVLQGQIDRLWFDEAADGWVILDYKSEGVGADLVAAAKAHERQLLAYGWAATRIIEAHGQRPVVRGEVYFTAVGAFVPLGPWGPEDFARLGARLDEVAEVAALAWDEVERLAARAPRSCPTCGYYRRGCRGSALFET